ncbi:MAG TPA: GNAT family N-acetyltransferase [Planctomycetota bacterium]|nr:GNAT family N-acetyltransferase [Planctomycetota bacterium]
MSPDEIRPGVYVRSASADDLRAVVDIYNDAVTTRHSGAEARPVPVEARRSWLMHRDPRRPVWVAEENGAVVAWISLDAFRPNPGYGRTAEVNVYAAPPARGRGIGEALVRRALARSPGLEIDVLLAFILGVNRPTLALFAKVGFATWGVLPDVVVHDGNPAPVVIVGRRLQR